jgi:hypothetical protein
MVTIRLSHSDAQYLEFLLAKQVDTVQEYLDHIESTSQSAHSTFDFGQEIIDADRAILDGYKAGLDVVVRVYDAVLDANRV